MDYWLTGSQTIWIKKKNPIKMTLVVKHRHLNKSQTEAINDIFLKQVQYSLQLSITLDDNQLKKRLFISQEHTNTTKDNVINVTTIQTVQIRILDHFWTEHMHEELTIREVTDLCWPCCDWAQTDRSGPAHASHHSTGTESRSGVGRAGWSWWTPQTALLSGTAFSWRHCSRRWRKHLVSPNAQDLQISHWSS